MQIIETFRHNGKDFGIEAGTSNGEVAVFAVIKGRTGWSEVEPPMGADTPDELKERIRARY